MFSNMTGTDYNKIIERSGLVQAGMIPIKYTNTIIQEVVTQSALLSRMRQLPNMSTRVENIPVMNLFPSAYFVDSEAGDGSGSTFSEGLAKTTRQMWGGSLLTAAKLMVLVPIPKDTIADAEGFGYDLWGEVKPRIVETTARTIDRAILQGINKPIAWPQGIVQGAISKGMSVQHKATANQDYYDELFSTGGVFTMVEKKRYKVDGIIADLSVPGELRGVRNSFGQPILYDDPEEAYDFKLGGIQGTVPDNGCIDVTSDPNPALMIVGAFKSAVFSWRTDIALQMSDVATVTDDTGAVVYNAFGQDLVIAKLTCRLGWQMPIPAHIALPAASRYPFSVLTPATA